MMPTENCSFKPMTNALVWIIIFFIFLIPVSPVNAQGFAGRVNLTQATTIRNTGDKPQSKVWKYDGKWWSVFPISTGTYIWRLDDISWTSALKISTSTPVKADCKVDGNVCHILLFRNDDSPSQLISVEYDPSSGTYKPWTKRPSSTLIDLDPGAEIGTIDIDGNGRMWLASDGIDDIRVRWSDSPYATWSAPIIIATGITDDDISAVIALPKQNQIGVLWSDQNTKRFGFRTHDTGALPATWSANEVPASQSALNIGKGMGDDHLNMAVATDGTLYCAVKTSYDTPGYPQLALLKRQPSGKWDNLYEVSQSGTRGIIILNEVVGKIKIIYTSVEDGGDILYRESSTSNISFSSPMTLFSGVYNNPTSSKNNYDSDIVILASDNSKIVGVLASDDPATITSAEWPAIPPPAKLYPNPVHDVIHLEFNYTFDNDLSVSIFDPVGKFHRRFDTKTENHKIEIDLRNENLAPGLHWLIINTSKSSQIIKFIKN